jgi:hypothetical protein
MGWLCIVVTAALQQAATASDLRRHETRPLTRGLASAWRENHSPDKALEWISDGIHYRTSRAFSSQGRPPERTPSHLRCAMSFAISPGYTNTTVGRRAGSLVGSASSGEAITTSAAERSERSTAAHAGIALTRGGPDLAAAADDFHQSRDRSGIGPPRVADLVHLARLVRLDRRARLPRRSDRPLWCRSALGSLDREHPFGVCRSDSARIASAIPRVVFDHDQVAPGSRHRR